MSDFKAYICFYIYLLLLETYMYILLCNSLSIPLLFPIPLLLRLYLFLLQTCLLFSCFTFVYFVGAVFYELKQSILWFVCWYKWKSCLATVLITILDIVDRRKSNLIDLQHWIWWYDKTWSSNNVSSYFQCWLLYRNWLVVFLEGINFLTL